MSSGSRTWCPAPRRRYIPRHTTQALHTPSLHSLYSVYVQEHEWVVQPVNIQEYRFQDMVPCTEAEIHSQTHYTGTSHSPLHSLYSLYFVCVQEHEWVVQPVNIQEYRFQDVVPCTEAEIHSQTHYTGTSHSTLHSLSFINYPAFIKRLTIYVSVLQKKFIELFFVQSVLYCRCFISLFFVGSKQWEFFTN